MKEITNILFPTDFSPSAQNAFRYCLMLADKYDAGIELLHVIYPEYEMMDLPVVAAQATREKIEAAREILKTFTDQGIAQVQAGYALTKLPPVNADVEVGSPVEIITRIAERDEIDLIVMGTKGTHNVLERTFGSVTTGVMRRVNCPVWIIPEKAVIKDFKIVAYASDLQEADPYQIWRAGHLLSPFNPIIHCVHVNVDSSMEHVLDFADLGKFFEKNVPGLQIDFHTLNGEDIVASLEEFVDIHDVDLLVMFAPNYSWLDRLFHRSNTRRMAMNTTHPLLVLKL